MLREVPRNELGVFEVFFSQGIHVVLVPVDMISVQCNSETSLNSEPDTSCQFSENSSKQFHHVSEKQHISVH